MCQLEVSSSDDRHPLLVRVFVKSSSSDMIVLIKLVLRSNACVHLQFYRDLNYDFRLLTDENE